MMGKLNWIGEPGIRSSDPTDEGALLAAALAATLVAYRQQVDQAGGPAGEQSVPPGRSNWRILGRWEQLRGR
jgi:hypothetical protein